MLLVQFFPDAPDALDELHRIKDMGLKGVKLHPDYQGFFVDDEKLKPIYKKISELGLITVFHAGVDFGFAPPYCATPERLEKALSWFESPVVAAHFGGLACYEGVLERLCGKENLYIDTSFGYSTLPRYYALKIIEKHSADKVLFGTDTPWHTAKMELRLLENLALGVDELEKIKYKNALKMLRIKKIYKILKKVLTNGIRCGNISKSPKGDTQLVLIAVRVHPFPYRTRKLSSLALKILGGKLPGKISRCQHSRHIATGYVSFLLNQA